MTLRTAVFWLHLATGLTAGSVILVMSVTGVLLAFEPQLVERAERDLWRAAPPTVDAPRLPLAAVVAGAPAGAGSERATTVTLRPDPRSSVRVGFGRDGAVFMNPYTGAVVGPGSRTHDVLHAIEDWHRWLGSRDLGRPITGACNLAFLGLALSGLYLWWPRAWSRSAVRAVTVLDVGLRGRARDFNWHNAFGFWCAPILVVLTLTGAVMSYQWANDLLYRMTGNEPPPAAGPAGARGARRRAGEREQAARPRRALHAGRRPVGRLGDPDPAVAPATGRSGDCPHPGAAVLASEPALGAHARRRHRGGRALGAVRRRQHGTQAARARPGPAHR